MWLGADGLVLPIVVPVDDLPELSDYRLPVGLQELHGAIVWTHLDGKGHLAMALCRPGAAEATTMDAEWAHDFRGLFGEVHTDRTWSLHLAAGGRVSELVGPPSSIRCRDGGHPLRRTGPGCPQFRRGRASGLRTLRRCVIFSSPVCCAARWPVSCSGRRC